MVDSTGEFILIWPGNLPDGTVVRLNKEYVEQNCAWKEITDRVVAWRIR